MDYSDITNMEDHPLRPPTFFQFTRANNLLKVPHPSLSTVAALEADIREYASYGHYYAFLGLLEEMLDSEIKHFDFIPHPGHRSFKDWFNLLDEDYINRHFLTGDILTRRQRWLELMDEYAAGLRLPGNVEDSEARFLRIRKSYAVNNRVKLEGRSPCGYRPSRQPRPCGYRPTPARQARDSSVPDLMRSNCPAEFGSEAEAQEFYDRLEESVFGYVRQ